MRKPTHPGQILHHEFLAPLGLTQRHLADHLGVDVKTVNRLVQGHTSVSPAMALQLGATFSTNAEFWLNLQQAYDLWEKKQTLDKLPTPLHHAAPAL